MLTTVFEEQLRDSVTGIPNLAILVLFGSRARGCERPDSDLDIAILPAADAPDEASTRLHLQLEVIKALADLAPDGRVDTVFLDEAPAALRQKVMEHGRMILCRDEAAWKRLRVATMKEYGDQEWARRIYRRALKKRLLEGRPNGRSANTGQPLERLRGLSR